MCQHDYAQRSSGMGRLMRWRGSTRSHTLFFDSRDLLQVKYEMLRRVREEGESVSAAATRFGLSRPTFYTAQGAYETGGLPALVPARPGPRRAHKLGAEVVEARGAAREQRPSPSSRELVELVRERFGLSVHRRSIDRVLARQKNARERPAPFTTGRRRRPASRPATNDCAVRPCAPGRCGTGRRSRFWHNGVSQPGWMSSPRCPRRRSPPRRVTRSRCRQTWKRARSTSC